MSQSILELKQVSHSYNRVSSIQGIDLEVQKGEIICLLGPSGSGKSTLLRIIAGLEQVSHGCVVCSGSKVADEKNFVPANKRDIGMLFQDFGLFPHMTVFDNVAYGISFMSNKDQKKRVTEVLSQVGMEGFCSRFPHTLSGGQQQRIALARAAAPEPEILLLDEPFSGLDSRLRYQLRRDTLDFLRSNNVASIIVTHDPEEAMYMADRIVLLKEGQVIQVGSPEDLYFSPKTSFVASFFGEVNIMQGIYHHGKFACDLGSLPCNKITYKEGDRLMAFVRYEAFEFLGSRGIAAPEGVIFEATIKDSHLIGAQRISRLVVNPKINPSCPPMDIVVKHYATKSNQVGERILCRLDLRHVHYFGIQEN